LAPTGLPFPFPPHAFLVFGNEDLNASCVKAYEFGYTYQRQTLRLNAEFFWNNYRGTISGVTQTAPGAMPRIDTLGKRCQAPFLLSAFLVPKRPI